MACDSLTQQATRLNVTLGNLPEGFCPSSMQELGEAIAQRLIITPVFSSSSFAIGPIAPTSNVGPWLKDCEEWFVWSDLTASYVPIEKQGFNNEQYFTASGDFIVPDFVFKLKVSAWGAGGGGGTVSGGTAGAGGGGGGYSHGIFDVVPGQVIPIGVGTGGATGAPGLVGGDTTVLTIVARGGNGGKDGTGTIIAGLGGQANGGTVNTNGQAGHINQTGNGGDGGDAAGGGGSGGNIDSTNRPDAINGTAPGGGGCGGGTVGFLPGSGANGAALLEW